MAEIISPAEQVTRVAALLGRAVLRWKREKEQSSEISEIVSDSLSDEREAIATSKTSKRSKRLYCSTAVDWISTHDNAGWTIFFRAHFLPNGIHNPGELRESQLAFSPTRWDMLCRINLSRILRANSDANGSLPCLPWAWPAFWTKGPKSLRTLATQALSFSPD